MLYWTSRWEGSLTLAAALIILCLPPACRKDPLALAVFRELPAPVSDDLSAVWFADSLHGFVTGGSPWERGVLLATADGGKSWQIDTIVHNRLECVMCTPAGKAYACGLDGLVLQRAPDESFWYAIRTDYCWNRCCYFRDDHNGVVVAGEGFQGGLARKLGPEAAWIQDTLIPYPNALSAVWYSDSVTVHAVGLGYVLRSADGGNSWERLQLTGDFFQSVHFPTASTGYICGSAGTLLKTTDGGRNWATVRAGGSFGQKHQPFRALWFTSPDKGYLVGDQGLFWRTENGGADWTALAGLPESVNATDVFVLGGQGWITCTGGRIFYFEE